MVDFEEESIEWNSRSIMEFLNSSPSKFLNVNPCKNVLYKGKKIQFIKFHHKS
jgi:hypothetical protein